MLVLVKNSLVKKKEVRCNSQFFCSHSSGRSLRTFSHSHCLACQDELFINNSLDVKENYEHALEFALHLSHLFSLGEFGPSMYGSCCLVKMLV
jgi:hypothetical protein